MRFMTISLFLLMFSLAWNTQLSLENDYSAETGKSLFQYSDTIAVNTTKLEEVVGSDPNQSIRKFNFKMDSHILLQ